MKILYKIACLVSDAFIRLCYSHKVLGYDVREYSKGAILACNHASFLDPSIIAASCPQEICFLARSSLFKNALFGKLISSLNAYPVKRGRVDLKSFRQVVSLLKENKKIMFFPEGRRSCDGQLQQFKPGVFTLADKTQSAIIPVYIYGSFEAWGRYRKYPKLSGQTACIFGRPIEYPFNYDATTKEGLQLLGKELQSKINELKIWYEEGAKGELP
jgi:1-acyl-sn-glycerol-3-phosphate acyltransferase